MNILIVLTSHQNLGETTAKTGLWLDEFTVPFYAFKDNNYTVTLASPNGQQVPVDPKSDTPELQTESVLRFKNDPDAVTQLANTLLLSTINPADYDAVFYPGGHGPLWDLSQDIASQKIIEWCYQNNKPTGLVCHGPAALKAPKNPDGSPLITGKNVTGFSDSEEAAVGLTEVVPFLLEDMLTSQGAHYSKGADWQSYVVVDKNLITGQNPASALAVATEIIHQLQDH
ncbi:type 1 glutamine amidotransferase domain-containing protein [Photobacterium kishitanii]|uniref:type 1 glutamine amidotransferase domain-containing protein n=1 Tax=Photobacterium kishitanii TaxID=318456 RepID=UPI0005D321CD|nr:type 1 glutamine amidotransferase domain-containing protein [Photobacterium kishitanii]KJG07634.1 dimethylallyltransferase [Photobacterium kishitanii]OBU33599.1 dimethylallyltransferase [Photobacterium kishitanii]PSV04857.1 type 1 glutamine amidotransferase domain-containing protein [Photobacterium kishitanii]PSV74256.1 type 1 glutamine amidotransferase domain-containing protein [Photobacterium kishitanii]PSW49735.1 type 1 glutamine amidotransferase domain-containing protein [Photobacterium